MTQIHLLERLEADLKQVLEVLRTELAPLDESALQFRRQPARWTAFEYCAHLNAYYDYYLPLIELSIHKAKARKWTPAHEVKYTGAGKRAIRKVDPINTKTYKAKKAYNFAYAPLGKTEVKSLAINIERLLRYIQQSKEIDLNQPKIKVASSLFGSFTLGNSLEWLSLHTQRHLNQMRAGTFLNQGLTNV